MQLVMPSLCSCYVRKLQRLWVTRNMEIMSTGTKMMNYLAIDLSILELDIGPILELTSCKDKSWKTWLCTMVVKKNCTYVCKWTLDKINYAFFKIRIMKFIVLNDIIGNNEFQLWKPFYDFFELFLLNILFSIAETIWRFWKRSWLFLAWIITNTSEAHPFCTAPLRLCAPTNRRE